jgi:hypothetical protein
VTCTPPAQVLSAMHTAVYVRSVRSRRGAPLTPAQHSLELLCFAGAVQDVSVARRARVHARWVAVLTRGGARAQRWWSAVSLGRHLAGWGSHSVFRQAPCEPQLARWPAVM